MGDLYQAKRIKRMDRVDALSPDLRALVHEHGLTVVDAFMSCGVTKARQIAHLISVVREGSVEIGNRTEAPLLMRTSLSSPAPDVERGEG